MRRSSIAPAVAAADEQVQAKEAAAVAHAADRGAIVIDASGMTAKLPPTAVEVLTQALDVLAGGDAVVVVSIGAELSTMGAAEMLGVSRPHLVKNILGDSSGQIPYYMVGRHRRMRLSDVLDYKVKRDATRQQAIDRIADLSADKDLPM